MFKERANFLKGYFYHINYFFFFIFISFFIIEILVIKNSLNSEIVYHENFAKNLLILHDHEFSEDSKKTNRDKKYMTSALGKGIEKGSLEVRKLNRWVGLYIDYNLFKFVYDKFNSKLLLIFYSLYFSIFVTMTLYFVNQTHILINKKNITQSNLEYTNFYLIMIIFALIFFLSIYQFYSPEISFSIKETFFISAGLFFTLKKNKLFFILIILVAPLIRESGLIISLFWFIFYRKDKISYFFPILSLIPFIAFNYDIINYFFKYGYLISFEPQAGQITWWDNKTINLNLIRIIFINYGIYLFALIILINLIKETKRLKLILLSFFYLIILLMFTTTSHYSSKFLIAPFMTLLIVDVLRSKNYLKND